MASILEIDPEQAGLAQMASIVGQASAPSRMPVGLGSILGQAAGGYMQAKNQAAMAASQLEERNLKIAEAQRQQKARQDFNSILGKQQAAGEPMDEISILNAGLQSGAFGPAETSAYMSKVVEKKAAREQRMDEIRMKLSDQQMAREQREAFAREMQGLQNQAREDLARLAASLRPERPQEPLEKVMKDGKVVLVPRSQAVGMEVPPSNANRPLPPTAIKDLGEKGESVTTFTRLSDNFKDDYGGKGTQFSGDVQNFIGRNVGMGKTDQATWWQDYQNQKNIVRNKLFGSALTATEKAEFDKANIDPGMRPDVIRENLGRQKAAAVRAARRLSRAYTAGGYSDEQIEGALGFTVEDLESLESSGTGSTASTAKTPKPWEKRR